MASPGVQLAPRVGEIVESDSQHFTAQCYRLYQGPPLGALVKTCSPDIYGVVSHISTGPLYTGRPVLPRGQEEETEEDIYRSHPQLDRLLCTRFQAVVVGYTAEDRVQQALPPFPPHIHAFVQHCPPDEVASFTQRMDYLRLLLSAPATPGDEVVAACLLQASSCHEHRQAFLLKAGKALASVLASELPRLNALLRRISP